MTKHLRALPALPEDQSSIPSNPPDSSQLSVIPVSEDLLPPFDILGNCMHVLPKIYIQTNTHMHKIKTFLKSQNKFKFTFSPCICELLYVYACANCMSGASGAQKRVLDALELEVQVVVRCSIGTRN